MPRIYGVRGPDPRNTVMKAESVENAVEMLFPDDIVVVSYDEGKTWQGARVYVAKDGEIRNYESSICDHCGTALVLSGWLCSDCDTARRR